MARLTKKGQISGLQAFLLGILGVAIFLIVGLMVLTSLQDTDRPTYAFTDTDLNVSSGSATLSGSECAAITTITGGDTYSGQENDLLIFYPLDINALDYSNYGNNATASGAAHVRTSKYGGGSYDFN